MAPAPIQERDPLDLSDEEDESGSEDEQPTPSSSKTTTTANTLANGQATGRRPAPVDEDVKEVHIDVTKLNPLSPEVISKQATINIGLSPSSSSERGKSSTISTTGTIGHVAHGKSTVVKAISGVQTVRFKNELERNITIKLGYANAKIYRCEKESCARPACYRSYGSDKEDRPPCEVQGCGGRMKLLR